MDEIGVIVLNNHQISIDRGRGDRKTASLVRLNFACDIMKVHIHGMGADGNGCWLNVLRGYQVRRGFGFGGLVLEQIENSVQW
jgi:hypothetical protein